MRRPVDRMGSDESCLQKGSNGSMRMGTCTRRKWPAPRSQKPDCCTAAICPSRRCGRRRYREEWARARRNHTCDTTDSTSSVPLASFSFRWIAFAAARPPPDGVDRGRRCCERSRSLVPLPRSACGAPLTSSPCSRSLSGWRVVADNDGSTEVDEGALPSIEGQLRRTTPRPDGGEAPVGAWVVNSSPQCFLRKLRSPRQGTPRSKSNPPASPSANAVPNRKAIG
jgi:hypothetical protein